MVIWQELAINSTTQQYVNNGLIPTAKPKAGWGKRSSSWLQMEIPIVNEMKWENTNIFYPTFSQQNYSFYSSVT